VLTAADQSSCRMLANYAKPEDGVGVLEQSRLRAQYWQCDLLHASSIQPCRDDGKNSILYGGVAFLWIPEFRKEGCERNLYHRFKELSLLKGSPHCLANLILSRIESVCLGCKLDPCIDLDAQRPNLLALQWFSHK
jgi:hypothetical protein